MDIKGTERHVWVGDICSFSDVLKNTCLQTVMTEEGIEYFSNIPISVRKIRIMYTRCKDSILLLDDIHRNYINKKKTKKKRGCCYKVFCRQR